MRWPLLSCPLTSPSARRTRGTTFRSCQSWEWLVIHEGWRSELPDQLGEGVQIVGVARAMGMRNRVTWRVTKWDPPHEVAMTGSGKGGTKYGVTLTVRPTKGGSALGLRLELGGRALFGPLGSAAARAVKGDVEKSLKQFAELYG